MFTRVAYCLAALGLLAACPQSEDNKNLPKDAEPMPDGEVDLKDPPPPADTPPPSAEPAPAYVASTTVVRKTKSTDSKVADPNNPAKKMSNWVATLYRGEELTIVSEDGEWAEVKTSGDQTGFAQRSGLLKQDEVTLATVVEEAKTFARPDILTMNATKTVEAGTLLYVLKEKGEFAEANFSGTQNVWLRSDAMSKDTTEVAVAKLLTQVRYQEKRGKEDNLAKAKQLKELGLSTYPDAALTKLLKPADDEEMNEGEGEENAPAEEAKAAAETAAAANADPAKPATEAPAKKPAAATATPLAPKTTPPPSK